MRLSLRRVLLFVLAGVLLFNLIDAIRHGGRATWLLVAVMALVLAFNLWVDARAKNKDRPPT